MNIYIHTTADSQHIGNTIYYNTGDTEIQVHEDFSIELIAVVINDNDIELISNNYIIKGIIQE